MQFFLSQDSVTWVVLIACSRIFREANSGMYDFPQLRSTISIGTCFNTPMHSVLRFVVGSFSPCHFILWQVSFTCSALFCLNWGARSDIHYTTKCRTLENMDSILCVVPRRSLTFCHVIPGEVVAVNLTHLTIVLTVWEVCSVSGPTKSSKVSKQIVVKPYALHAEAWGSFFCHCQCVFFDERAAALRSILHDHDSWRCLACCIEARIVLCMHDLEKPVMFFENFLRFNDSVSQPFWCDRLTRCLWIAQLEDCIVFSVGHGGDSRYLGHRNNVNGKRRVQRSNGAKSIPLPEAWWSSFGAKRVARVLCLVAMRASRHGRKHVSPPFQKMLLSTI